MQENDNSSDNQEQKWIEVPSFVNNNSKTYQPPYRMRKDLNDNDTKEVTGQINSSASRQNNSSAARQDHLSAARQNNFSAARYNQTSAVRHNISSAARQNSSSEAGQNNSFTTRKNNSFTAGENNPSVRRQNHSLAARQISSCEAEQITAAEAVQSDSCAARQDNSDTKEGAFVKDMSGHKKRKVPKPIKITVLILTFLSVVCCFLMFTDIGKKMIIDLAGNYIYSNLKYKNSGTRTAEGKNKDGDTAAGYTYEDKVVNILLIGIEEIKDAQNTDSMIIATMNTQDHSLKLTSLMRDLYVDIPGHESNRLNAAFSLGGINLLYDTIEQNFGIKVDGYCMVNFKAFEKIVDLVDGVQVTLTSEEAKYLNTTNYISNPANRHVVAGTQVLNGNQALGYCRVRKRPTATESNDFGRTQRQRTVLQAIYSKVKNKNVLELAVLMNKVLNEISIDTDIKNDEFNRYLEEAVNLKVNEIKTFRIPTDDNYENAKVTIGSHQGQEVLLPKDWDAARQEIHNFIYGTAN